MNPQLLSLLEAIPASRVFGLDQQTAIQIGIQLVNISVLAVFLSRFLYKPVREFLAKRTLRIQEQIQYAEAGVEQNTHLKAEYERKIKEVEQERSDILEAARKQAAERSKDMLARAKVEAEAIKSNATKDVALEQERAKDEMRISIINVSSALAEKFVKLSIDQNTQDKLFTDALAELEGSAFIHH